MAPFLDDNLKTFRKLQIIIATICIFIPLIFRCCDKDNFYPAMVQSSGLKKISSCTSLLEIDSAFMPKPRCDTVFRLKICKGYMLVDSIVKIRKDCLGFRASLSHYVYGSKSYLFGLFYCMAAMLFIFNGAVYLNNIQKFGALYPVISKSGPWYNLIIGLSLLGVVFCPLYDLPTLHYIFTALFFIGNFIVLAFFYNPGEAKIKTLRIVLSFSVVIILILLLLFYKLPVLWAEWFSLIAIGVHLILAVIATIPVKRMTLSSIQTNTT